VSRPCKSPASDSAVEHSAVELPHRVTCTDHGQHAEALIARFAEERDPDGGRKIVVAMTPGWDVLAAGGTGWITYRFRCRRCGRDVQLREETMGAVVDALQASGDREHLAIDISLLPC